MSDEPTSGGRDGGNADERDLSESALASRTVYHGRLLHVREDRVRLPNGREATREYIVHPGAVVCLPVFDNGDVLLERQYRYPLRRIFYEFPAGKLEALESPAACARRELLEETGYSAAHWRRLTTIHPCIGYSDERLEFYLATGLSFEGARPDEDEFVESFRVSQDEAMEWVRTGKISETKTVIGLFWLEKIRAENW